MLENVVAGIPSKPGALLHDVKIRGGRSEEPEASTAGGNLLQTERHYAQGPSYLSNDCPHMMGDQNLGTARFYESVG